MGRSRLFFVGCLCGVIMASMVHLLPVSAEVSPLYVCEAGDPNFLGTYTADGEMDGAPKYTNEAQMSVFRNSGFWYAGSLERYPPDTHYRCVRDCARNAATPPLGPGFDTNPRFGVDPPPQIQDTPCGLSDEL